MGGNSGTQMSMGFQHVWHCTESEQQTQLYVGGLQPRMPGRVHPTQVVQAVGSGYQSAHSTVSAFKCRQICTQ